MAICSDCLNDKYNVDKIDDVLSLLRKLDRPFLKNIWEDQKAKDGDKFTFGKYLRSISSSKKYRTYTYANSDHINGESSYSLDDLEIIIGDDGQQIEFSEKLVFEWGGGFSKLEYLKLEKMYQDSLQIYEAVSPIDRDQLRTLAKISLRREKAIEVTDVDAFDKYSKQYDSIMKNQSLRPADRQGKDQQAGMKSFSQIFKRVERDGYTAPKKLVVTKDEEDIYDRMIVSILNYYNRIVGEDLLERVPDEEKAMYAESFTESDHELTPDEIAEKKILEADLDEQRKIMSPDSLSKAPEAE